MAIFDCEFFSQSLSRRVPFTFISSNDAQAYIKKDNECYKRKAKTILLLHGFTEYKNDWLYNTEIKDLSLKYNINFIIPNGENSFYLNQESRIYRYADYVGKELIEYARNTFSLSGKREDTFIMGISMGGFGAIHTGLLFPNTFKCIAGLSSALIIHNIQGMKKGTFDGIADYEYYRSIFGDLDKVEESENNPETLVLKNLNENIPMPQIFLACGTEDFLYKENQIFRNFLASHNVDFEYYEEKGVHNFIFWNKYIEKAIKSFLGINESK